DGDRIVGVRHRASGAERAVRAHLGVILACGQFGSSPELLRKYCPRLADPRITAQGSTFDDGAGHLLGLADGGVLDHMAGALITSPFYPPEGLIHGILVNREGRRFVNEDSYHSRSSIACLDQPGGAAFLIVDDSFFERPLYGWQELVDA